MEFLGYKPETSPTRHQDLKRTGDYDAKKIMPASGYSASNAPCSGWGKTNKSGEAGKRLSQRHRLKLHQTERGGGGSEAAHARTKGSCWKARALVAKWSEVVARWSAVERKRKCVWRHAKDWVTFGLDAAR